MSSPLLQDEWFCYGPKLTHSPRFSRSVRAGAQELRCRRDTSAKMRAKLTHTWVWVVRWAPPCSTWPTPSCLCWWSRGRDHMASHYRPLQVHSGSAPARCLGSTEDTHPCSGISSGLPLFVNALLCCYCCTEQERIKQGLYLQSKGRGEKAEKELRRGCGGHGKGWIQHIR